MNVKQFCGMIRRDTPVSVTLCTEGGELNQKLDLSNSIQSQLYGAFKVKAFRAMGEDVYEVELDMKPAEIIVEI